MIKLNYSNSLIELGKRFNFEKDEKTKFPFFKLDRTKKLMNLLGNPQNDNFQPRNSLFDRSAIWYIGRVFCRPGIHGNL